MPRPRKPTSILKLEGAYAPSRHGERSGEPVAKGTPARPSNMTKHAADHWDSVVHQLVTMGVAREIDQTALEQMCEWYAEIKRLQAIKNKKYSEVMLWAAAHKQWRDLASKFGMTPSDRARLDVSNKDESDPAARFIG